MTEEQVEEALKGYEDLGPYGLGMSNFDHSVDPGTEDLLKTGKITCRHSAAGFNGNVWYQDGVFHEAVFRYHVFAGHRQAPTMRELMTKVNNEYGWE